MHPETVPTLQAEPTILGFPADPPDDLDTAPSALPAGADAELFVLRSPDGAAGSLLLVAGAAGALSLFLPWLQHGEELGLSLVRRGLDSAGVLELARAGLLLPSAVTVGGGVLFLLGLLAFRPARSHRVTGVAALFVSLAVAAGIVVRVADLSWAAIGADPGVLCAIVLAALGTLGALKAMLTAPGVTTDPG
jgi:hypothetical protein